MLFNLKHTGYVMALKFKASKEEFDEFEEGTQALYTQDGDNYRLDVDGIDDGSELKEALRKEREERKSRQATIDGMNADKAAAEVETAKKLEEAARQSGDVEALDRSWSDKYTKLESDLRGEFEPQLAEQRALLLKSTVEAEATNIATSIAVRGSAGALMPHLQSRLAMEIKDGKAVTVVTNVDGTPSALTLAELKQEFTDNPVFAPLIVGSSASGGGASQSDSSGAAKPTGNFAGDRADRTAAIAARFPDLK